MASSSTQDEGSVGFVFGFGAEGVFRFRVLWFWGFGFRVQIGV